MNGEFHITDLRARLMAAKDRLAVERLSIFALYPLEDEYNREEYAFAYIRAERLGIKTIQRRMAEISWLPAKLDTSTDLTADTRDRLAHWVKHGENIKPDAAVFGNEFLHCLARCMLHHGPDSAEFKGLADRIALLFRDLSYLIASIHCCSMFKELGLEHVRLTAPNDLGKIAFDLTITLETIAMMHGGEAGEVNQNTPQAAPAHHEPPPYLRLVEPERADRPV
ncbi:MAG: hypothetical protein WDO70_01545 [Alphaproteobacteria bacterium]